jgi:hypothetical protein
MILLGALLFVCVSTGFADESFRIATFNVDVTPPLGSPLCCAAGVKPVEAAEEVSRAFWPATSAFMPTFHRSLPCKASPMTYMTNGRQYVAIASGGNILSFALANR